MGKGSKVTCLLKIVVSGQLTDLVKVTRNLMDELRFSLIVGPYFIDDN